MNPFEMVVLIVGLVMVASVLKARYRAKHGLVDDDYDDEDGNRRFIASEAANMKMRDDIQAMKERIAVLERLVTDEHGPRALDREIEKLR